MDDLPEQMEHLPENMEHLPEQMEHLPENMEGSPVNVEALTEEELREKLDDRFIGPDDYNATTATDSDPNEVPEGYSHVGARDLFRINLEDYLTCRGADVFGTANPSIMNNPFWIKQVGPTGLHARNARMIFQIAAPWFSSVDPIWSFKRMGETRNELPDGRIIYIGGSHEDHFSQDFCIYNDVVVFDAARRVDPPPPLTPSDINIYGYPGRVFPPIDFHTATFYADPSTGKQFIFIIGGLGYARQESRRRTDVYKLDLSDFSIHRVRTVGPGPIGGTYHHWAELVVEDGQSAIRIEREVPENPDYTRLEESFLGDDGDDIVMAEGIQVLNLRIRDMRWI